jgi:hypothetical protein
MLARCSLKNNLRIGVQRWREGDSILEHYKLSMANPLLKYGHFLWLAVSYFNSHFYDFRP